MTNRKWLILFVIAIVLIVGSYNLYEKFWSVHGTWNINYGLEVPKPSKMTTVIERHGFGDGEAYYVIEYNERRFEKAKEFELWNRMDNKSFTTISEQTSKFKKDMINLHQFEERDRYTKLFDDYPIEFDEDSLWYLKENHGGQSYFLAILNTRTKKLYIMENAF
jgi:hypothetical protein